MYTFLFFIRVCTGAVKRRRFLKCKAFEPLPQEANYNLSIKNQGYFLVEKMTEND